MPRTGPAWKRWLEDDHVFRWYKSMVIRTESTADERLRVLGRYCDAIGTTPTAIVEKAQQPRGITAIADQLQDFVSLLRSPHKPADHRTEDNTSARERCSKGHSPGYVANFVKAVRAWLRHNDIGLVRKIIAGDDGATPTIENERLPTPRELREILSAADERGRVIISLLAFSGVRPEVLGTRRAANGLQLKDLPDLRVRGGAVLFEKIPVRVVVRKELSKVRKKYLTFLPREGCDYVRAYLEHRLARGEKLDPESPIVRPDYGYEVMGRPEELQGRQFLGRQGISGEVRKVFRAKGFSGRPYVLRSYFDSALASAEREGKIIPLDREFFMGRVGAIDQRYTNLKDLPQKAIEEMRREFAACESFLATRERALEPEPGLPPEIQEMLTSSEFRKYMTTVPRLADQLQGMRRLFAAFYARASIESPDRVAEFERQIDELFSRPEFREATESVAELEKEYEAILARASSPISHEGRRGRNE